MTWRGWTWLAAAVIVIFLLLQVAIEHFPSVPIR